MLPLPQHMQPSSPLSACAQRAAGVAAGAIAGPSAMTAPAAPVTGVAAVGPKQQGQGQGQGLGGDAAPGARPPHVQAILMDSFTEQARPLVDGWMKSFFVPSTHVYRPATNNS
jgi:hypothetical protein